jgi:hypothetical protein
MDLGEVKDYLNITWDDPITESNLTRYVQDGQAYLNEIAGTELDYEKNYAAKRLLLDYCRYVYNHSLELFEVNFKRELLKLSVREGVKAHVASNSETPS